MAPHCITPSGDKTRIFQENGVNAMAADTLAPGVAWASRAMALIV